MASPRTKRVLQDIKVKDENSICFGNCNYNNTIFLKQYQ